MLMHHECYEVLVPSIFLFVFKWFYVINNFKLISETEKC